MECTKAQLLALFLRLERDLMESCQREIERVRGQTEVCNRILSVFRAWKSRVESLAESEIESEFFG